VLKINIGPQLLSIIDIFLLLQESDKISQDTNHHCLASSLMGANFEMQYFLLSQSAKAYYLFFSTDILNKSRMDKVHTRHG